jgi:3-dehydroshikimate dehydratase
MKPVSLIKIAIASVITAAALSTAHAKVYTVTKYADDGSRGTLRWAIEESNANPGPDTIQIVHVGRPPYVIKLNSLLPPIQGPLVIKGMQMPKAQVPQVVTDTVAALPAAVRARLPEAGVQRTPSIAIDGSNFLNGDDQASCPAFNPAQFGINVRTFSNPAFSVVDSGEVEIANLEIRNFCIGVLLLRSHDNYLHDLYIHNTAGASGIMITGDAGDATGSSTSGLSVNNVVEWNTLVDTGDAMECTRGTSRSVYRNNMAIETRTRDGAKAPWSQGIECAGALNDDLQILDNVFIAFSDGLQLNAATNVRVEGNVIANGTYGITTSGTGNVIRDNLITGNRMGVGPTNTARVTITQNSIYGNGLNRLSLPNSAGGTTNPASPARLGIDIGVNGRTANDFGAGCLDCNTVQNFPVLSTDSAWGSAPAPVLRGTLSTRPNASYTVEFFANHSLNAAGWGEGEVYLGELVVTTGPDGTAPFAFVVPTTDPLGDGSTAAYFTATATSRDTGATSEFSDALLLSK